MRLKGTVTVFLAILLVAVMGVVGALLESSRLQVAKEIVLDDAYLSFQNVLAEYQRELWNDYHVFFVDGTSLKGEKGLETLANQYLEDMVWSKGKTYLKAEAEFKRASFSEAMVEGGGKYFVKQAVDYMKLAAPKDVLASFMKETKGHELIEKGQRAFQDMVKAKYNMEKKLLKYEKKKEKIREKYAEINEELREIKELAGGLKTKEDVNLIIEKIRSYKEGNGKKKVEIENLKIEEEVEIEEGKKEINAYRKELENRKEELDKEDYENLKKGAETAFSNNELADQGLEKNEERLENILKLSEKEDLDIKDIRNELEEIKLEEEDKHRKKAKKRLRKYEKEAEKTIVEGERGSFFLNVIGAGNIKVSNKKIEQTVWKEYGDDEERVSNSGMDKALFLLYMKKHFPRFTAKSSENKEENSRKKEALDYGLEFIAIGKLSDEENLKGMAQRIFAIRTAVWFSHFLTRPDKIAEAAEIATAAVGVLGPAAVIAVKTGILLGWSAGEARKDVEELFNGNKIALHPNTPGIKTGYANYLDLFLLGSFSHWAERSLKLIEQNMRFRYNKDFQADNCFAGVVGEVRGVVEPRFFRLGFVGKWMTEDLKLWEFDYQLSQSLGR